MLGWNENPRQRRQMGDLPATGAGHLRMQGRQDLCTTEQRQHRAVHRRHSCTAGRIALATPAWGSGGRRQHSSMYCQGAMPATGVPQAFINRAPGARRARHSGAKQRLSTSQDYDHSRRQWAWCMGVAKIVCLAMQSGSGRALIGSAIAQRSHPQ